MKANNTFKKIYSIPHPPPKELLQETLYTVFPALELRLEFYVSVLQSLAISGETVYNVFGGSKFMYAAMVSSPSNYERAFVMFIDSDVLIVLALLSLSGLIWPCCNVDVYERTFVYADMFAIVATDAGVGCQ